MRGIEKIVSVSLPTFKGSNLNLKIVSMVYYEHELNLEAK